MLLMVPLNDVKAASTLAKLVVRVSIKAVSSWISLSFLPRVLAYVLSRAVLADVMASFRAPSSALNPESSVADL